MIRLVGPLLLLIMSAAAAGQEARMLRNRDSVTVDPATAYLLFREDPREGPGHFDYVFARELEAAVRDRRHAAPPNFDPGAQLIRTNTRRAFVNEQGRRSYLVAVPPGNYVIAAVAHRGMAFVGTCLCMGTVRFEARGGVVNDLGYLLGAIEDMASQIPELAPFTGSPSWTHTPPMMAIMSVRPAADGMEIPTELSAIPLVRTEYRAVAKFPNYLRTTINRIPPIPGILAYDGDRAVDLLATGN